MWFRLRPKQASSRGVAEAHLLTRMQRISDDVDAMNALDGAQSSDASAFDANEDKAKFRRYEVCDCMRDFSAVRLARPTAPSRVTARLRVGTAREADARVQRPDPRRLRVDRACIFAWATLELLDTPVDASDPDTLVGQFAHLLQTAEAMRRDAKLRWVQLTGLVRDLGNPFVHFGADGQSAVIGDAFPIDRRFGEKVIYLETLGP